MRKAQQANSRIGSVSPNQKPRAFQEIQKWEVRRKCDSPHSFRTSAEA